MDEKPSTDGKPKLSQSRARHIRRKRLMSAKKAATNDSACPTEPEFVQPDRTLNSEIKLATESLSKSKVRRLRKKNNKTRVETLSGTNEFSLNSGTHELLQNVENFKTLEISESKEATEENRNANVPRSNCDRKVGPTEESLGEKSVSQNSDTTKGSIEHVAVTLNPSKGLSTGEPKERKMQSQEKTRDQVKAEREAKKAAKAAAKSKGKNAKTEISGNVESAKAQIEAPSVRDDKIDQVDGEIVAKVNKLSIDACRDESSKEILDVPPRVEIGKESAKSKSEMRAERRAKQEAQRAAKQLEQAPVRAEPKLSDPKATKIMTAAKTVKPIVADAGPKVEKRTVVKEHAHEVNLFKHLYHEREQAFIDVPTVNSNIHPAIVRLGVQYSNKIIVGSNARCVALLAAVKRLIQDFERPPQADFTRGLEASFQESLAYLHHCRPLAVSMQNALKHLKWQMSQLPATTPDDQAKTKLSNSIDTYILEQIQLADKAISITIQTKISNGDVILTYGYSSLINKILCDAHDAGRQFRVVVVDGRPWLEGREQLRRLAKHGLECSYVLINALSFIMPEVSKVFLGAHAILANGAVMSRVGTAQVALMAKSFNVPVLVACETHKTCERVQTDSIVYNELADPDELVRNSAGGPKKSSLNNWRAHKSLNLLNITYDVTPADLVTAVVTEIAILPCSSVPVILRIKPSEI